MNKRQYKKVVDKYERAAKARKVVALTRVGLSLLSVGLKRATAKNNIDTIMLTHEMAHAQMQLYSIMGQSTRYSDRPNRPGVKIIRSTPTTAQPSLIKELFDDQDTNS
jgi:hypothetical protein